MKKNTPPVHIVDAQGLIEYLKRVLKNSEKN